jgi:four helix bundle protein
VAADRPDYKRHPLWADAMGLARDAYELAGRIRESDPEAARNLRRAAVSVPAHIAGALAAEQATEREADVASARTALAEVARHAAQAPRSVSIAPLSAELGRHARTLERSVAAALAGADGGRA